MIEQLESLANPQSESNTQKSTNEKECSTINLTTDVSSDSQLLDFESNTQETDPSNEHAILDTHVTISDENKMEKDEKSDLDACFDISKEIVQTTTSTESSDNALAEEISNDDSNKTKADPDAEMVSEDELPVPQKEVVLDAVEVSDDELPCPKIAELPTDAEAVSDDELPIKNVEEPASKRKRSDDESQSERDEKKVKDDTIETEEKKRLPDLDKYWKSVNEDPSDFTAWTYLLQYVDHEVSSHLLMQVFVY